MGKLQQLRAKALSLRGALAIGGAVVVAASMAQVAGTLAAPDAQRTATLSTSSENYFPTPLPDKDAPGFNGVGIKCESKYVFPANVAQISWPSVGAGYKYKVVQQRVNSNGDVYWSETRWTTNTTENFNYGVTAVTTQIHVYVVNESSGSTDGSRVVSSGFVGTNMYTPTASNSRCTNPVDNYRVDNQAWENQRAWDPTMESSAGRPGSPMFTTLMDVLNSEEMLEPLPEDTELADLDAAAAKPAPTSEATPTESETGTTEPSQTSPSADAAPAPESETSTSRKPSSSTRTATSTPRSTAASTKASTSKTPSTSRTTTRTSAPEASTPSASATTTRATTQRAGVGDDPIGVGTAFARLDEVDGQPQLIVTTAVGTEVCTMELPGATGITSTAGQLAVTVDGRTRTVDATTCAID